MQISVAHARERPADFRQNAQRPKGVPLGVIFGPLCRPPGVHIPNGLLSRTALDTGMGFARGEPTQRPLLAGARQNYLIPHTILVELELSFGIDDVELGKT